MSTKLQLPKEFLESIKAVTDKRPRLVIEHIMKHGHVTTEELRVQYGYTHPPRGARDVRENGIPLKTTMTKDSTGRRCGIYTFDLSVALSGGKAGGRRAFAKVIKDALIERDGLVCAICRLPFPARYLQVDHCVPYEVAGESLSDDLDQLMLACGSCNRGKSWSCEHCKNWTTDKKIAACKGCYWVNPDDHTHVALLQIRRIDAGWTGPEIVSFEKLKSLAKKNNMTIQEMLKEVVKQAPTLK